MIRHQCIICCFETTLAEITGTRTAIGDNLQVLQQRAQDVRRLVEAARMMCRYVKTPGRSITQVMSINGVLCEALKPFEETKHD